MNAWQFVNRQGQVFSCAWCQKELGVTPAAGESHGICQRHSTEMLRAVGIVLQRDADGVVTKLRVSGAAAGVERQVERTAPEAAAPTPSWKEAA